ncbi:MAG: hypothetical protein R2831_09725 [Chitinophagaceae bacterium]
MKNLFLLLFVLSSVNVFSQQRCASHDHLQTQLQNNPDMVIDRQQLEQYTQNYIATHTENKNSNKKTRAIHTIPVVFHIIHNGESIGTGANISENQVLSQLDALNEDYKIVEC